MITAPAFKWKASSMPCVLFTQVSSAFLPEKDIIEGGFLFACFEVELKIKEQIPIFSKAEIGSISIRLVCWIIEPSGDCCLANYRSNKLRGKDFRPNVGVFVACVPHLTCPCSVLKTKPIDCLPGPALSMMRSLTRRGASYRYVSSFHG